MQVVTNGFFHLPDWSTLADFIRLQLSRPFSSALLLWEWGALAFCLLLFTNAFIIPDARISSSARWLYRYAQQPWRAIWTCALLPMVIRVSLLPAAPLKPPSVHDEFSLLLLADTLRSGRLTNKAHLLWQHFETIHVIQQPAYRSMYPPGSGVFMAIGMLLGHPWIGVLLGMGILCGTLCWMLQAWISPPWAFAATLLAAAQIGTRPYEGALLTLGCSLLALHWYRRSTFGTSIVRWSILSPALAALLLGTGFTLYDSWRVAGSPFQTGYLVNRQTYGWPENLVYLPPVKVASRHPNLANMYGVEVGMRSRYNTLGRIVNNWFARWTVN